MDNPYHYYFVYRKLYNTVSGKLYCVYSLSYFVQSSQVYKFSYSYKTVSLQIIYSRMTSACFARLVLLQHTKKVNPFLYEKTLYTGKSVQNNIHPSPVRTSNKNYKFSKIQFTKMYDRIYALPPDTSF